MLPEIRIKKVTPRRRTITVSVIGNYLLPHDARKEYSVDEMISYLRRELDAESMNRPDLMVLPEVCDIFENMTLPARQEWYHKRGDSILHFLQEYARAHQTYLVYPSHFERSDGIWTNSSLLLDREGDPVAAYNKNYPTERELSIGVRPGNGPTVAETDFGTIGFLICFDLNFRELLAKYMELRPDLLAFSSAYPGGFMQSVWAYWCHSFFIGATIGRLEKTLLDPAGGYIRREQCYLHTFSEKINLNTALVHLDQRPALMEAKKFYGEKLLIRDPGHTGVVTVSGKDPDLPIGEMLRKFSVPTWDEYYQTSAQSVAACPAFQG